MIYWGLMKRNDRSVQETEHYLHLYKPLGKYDYFPWTGSFEQFISVNWYYLHFVYMIMQRGTSCNCVCKYIIKAPNSDVLHV